MSFNIWVSGGRSLSNCIAAIRISGADVIGLQECRADTAATIASQLGFQVTSHSGSPILSRYPIVETLNPTGGSGATIEISAGQRIHFFNSHLTAYPYGPYTLRDGGTQQSVLSGENATRMPALRSLLLAMKPYLSSSVPCFLTGDFNAPSHLDYTDFPWPTSLACIQAGMMDSFHEAVPGRRKFPGAFSFDDVGVTWTPLREEEPKGVFDRIDFIYVSTGDGVGILESAVLDERNSVKPWPSDHRAVLTRVKLPQSKPQKQASQPIPATGSMAITPTAQLCWLPGEGAESHRVFFGTNSNPPLWGEVLTQPIAIPSLRPDGHYYWRIDSVTATEVISGPVWEFTVSDFRTYEWEMSSLSFPAVSGVGRILPAGGEETIQGLKIVDTDGVTLPHANAASSSPVLRVARFSEPSSGLQVFLDGSQSNGNGRWINQYTLIWDLLIPRTLTRTALFNTNPTNANDADLYVLSNGRVGSVAAGFSDPGLFQASRWHRLALTADLAVRQVNLYLDGRRVLAGTGVLDGTYALPSSKTMGPTLLLFNEGDPSGVYTHELYLRGFLASDRTWADSEIAELGGVKVGPILPQHPPLTLGLSRQRDRMLLTWSGGRAPYQLQQAASLMRDWHILDDLTFATSKYLPAPEGQGYFRVIGAE